MTKFLRRFAFFMLILMQFAFLLSIFFDKMNAPLVLLFLGIISVLISVAYFKAPREQERYFIKDLYLILFAVTGAMSTFFINIELKLGPVIAAGLIGCLASFVPSINRKSKLLKEVPPAVYCGVFVGMTSASVAPNLKFILLAGFIAGSILMLSKNIFNGFGGKLGTIAFGSIAISSIILYTLF
ncbi:hypothetical protein DET49_13610 [Salegentibacter sp. 24]|uniref:hypothetical protein n=1 Tax=Salegentibacter sp. 24 TaxID=2183986 RepID=UPI00105D9005|nr:hypothetical protein [Salegentibacter sp. 24]TDN79648.1 hypothetical protein DET49_13610 [Salegentibacter sp. 24]